MNDDRPQLPPPLPPSATDDSLNYDAVSAFTGANKKKATDPEGKKPATKEADKTEDSPGWLFLGFLTMIGIGWYFFGQPGAEVVTVIIVMFCLAVLMSEKRS